MTGSRWRIDKGGRKKSKADKQAAAHAYLSQHDDSICFWCLQPNTKYAFEIGRRKRIPTIGPVIDKGDGGMKMTKGDGVGTQEREVKQSEAKRRKVTWPS